jgi:hypothetical protein
MTHIKEDSKAEEAYTKASKETGLSEDSVRLIVNYVFTWIHNYISETKQRYTRPEEILIGNFGRFTPSEIYMNWWKMNKANKDIADNTIVFKKSNVYINPAKKKKQNNHGQ